MKIPYTGLVYLQEQYDKATIDHLTRRLAEHGIRKEDVIAFGDPHRIPEGSLMVVLAGPDVNDAIKIYQHSGTTEGTPESLVSWLTKGEPYFTIPARPKDSI